MLFEVRARLLKAAGDGAGAQVDQHGEHLDELGLAGASVAREHNVLACSAAVVEQHELERKVGREDVAALVHELLGERCLERVVHEVHENVRTPQNVVDAEDLKARVCLEV